MATTPDYSAASLTVLKGLEAVRKRPGMYIGDNGTRGLTHLGFEIIDNSVDEALAGHCDTITITLHPDRSVEVADNGRGIPVDKEPETGIPGAILVLTELHAGGKFGDTGYEMSGGLHGVGAAVVNALSSKLEMEVDRGGHTHLATFKEGTPGFFQKDGTFKPANEMRKVRKISAKQTGTRVRYWPDADLFLPDAHTDAEQLKARARQTAFLVPGLSLIFRDLTGETPTEETFKFDGGLADLVAYRAKEPALNSAAPIVLESTGAFSERIPVMEDGKQVLREVERKCIVDIGLQWGSGFDPDVTSFVNIVHTPKGGTHVAGFERALVRTINQQLKEHRISRAKDAPVNKDDVLEGLTAVVVVKLAEPQFIGQTKDELGTQPVTGIVADAVATNLTKWFTTTKNRTTARAILEKIQHASRARLAAREVRAAQRRKTALENAAMPAKLVDCRSEDVDRAELFIVEGDSALGTFKNGRDSEFQAALPVRGKILNVHSLSQKNMLDNAECAAIIQVLGAGFGKSFNAENLRYGKLIALCDADVDGAHIRALLLTFCFKYMKPLLEEGRFYSAVPPLHRIEVVAPKKEYIYTYSDAELHETLTDLEKQGKRIKESGGIQRYKGLGEMDAEQLAETTLDPAHRRLRRMTMDDAAVAAEAFDLCMGREVAPRREFIMQEGGLLDANLIDA